MRCIVGLSMLANRATARSAIRSIVALAFAAPLWSAPPARAQIVRWDNGQVIPGTEGITPGPGVQLSGWASDGHNLRYANLSSQGGTLIDVSKGDFSQSWLDYARLDESVAVGANFNGATLTNANLGLVDLWQSTFVLANLTAANLAASALVRANLTGATLASANATSANLADANLTDANFAGALMTYSTLTNANLTGANLDGANLFSATLGMANLTDATVSHANLSDTTSRGFSQSQLYATRSYLARDLRGISLGFNNDFSGWNFSKQDLSDAGLQFAQFGGADFTGATLTRAALHDSVLTNANLSNANLTSANLGGAILTGATLGGSTLANADLTNALVAGADLGDTTSRGFTKDQFYSTRSYQEMLPNPFEGYRELGAIGLSSNDLAGWILWRSNLTGANLTGSSVAGADLQRSLLFSANLSGSDLSGANLMSTRIAGANLAGALCINANLGFLPVTYYDVDLSFADLRGAANLPTDVPTPPYVNSLRNTISPGGELAGVDLLAGERLIIHDDDGVAAPAPDQSWLTARPPIPVRIQDHLTSADGGVLELRFDADPWDSLISFAPGIPVDLGGTLALTFAKDADAAPQVGHTLHIFDWSGVSPSGAFTVSSLYVWDTSSLYTAGVVTLLAAGGVIAGDSNADGQVDLADFGTLKDHFGAPGAKAEGDANGDGRIDLNDFGLLKANFGKSAAAVPEPATVVLAALGWALVHFGRRRGGAS